MTTVIRILLVACLLVGCAELKSDRDLARERAQAYVAAHPELDSTTAEEIMSNSIHNGMTMEQVIAAWGQPIEKQVFRDGVVQHWFFGCDWPHTCGSARREFSERFHSQALFENGAVVDWES